MQADSLSLGSLTAAVLRGVYCTCSVLKLMYWTAPARGIDVQ
jgi:hypothetical protein